MLVRFIVLAGFTTLAPAALWSADAPLPPGFACKGLVAVGRIPADSFDQRTIQGQERQDTLGAVFHGMAFDPGTWTESRLPDGNSAYRGTLYGMPDRGFGGGANDYLPRRQQFHIMVAPEYGPGPNGQSQITFESSGTRLLTYGPESDPFTGIGADSSFSLYPRSVPAGVSMVGPVQDENGEVNPAGMEPQSSPATLGSGRRSLDPGGVALLPDGSFFVSDSVGPLIYHFGRDGHLMESVTPPAALLPRRGAVFGKRKNDFGSSDASGPLDSGRSHRGGFSGISASNDGTRLFAMLAAPPVQDSGSTPDERALARNTRLLEFDIETGSVTYGQLVGEYILQLHADSAAPLAEGIIALNDHQLLILECDPYGRGHRDPSSQPPKRKSVLLAELRGATNIAGSGYDLEQGAQGQVNVPANGLPSELVPMTTSELVNLLDGKELGKFSLNAKSDASSDGNTLAAKWGGIALAPLHDPNAIDDYLLLVGNDNGFQARHVFCNGAEIAHNEHEVDTMLLGWRVTLTGIRN